MEWGRMNRQFRMGLGMLRMCRRSILGMHCRVAGVGVDGMLKNVREGVEYKPPRATVVTGQAIMSWAF